jgi:enoyl-CoA hydratase
MDAGVQVETKGDVCCVRLDDGKVNALSQAKIEAVVAALERAEKESKALLLLGRPGRFCAGFDLSVMRGGGRDALTGLVRAGMELCLRLRESRLPVVIGCTGHALAMGGVLLMAADERLGARGDFKIGLNETAIGMTLPRSAVEIVRERLAKPYFERAVVAAEVFAPEQAAEAGFLDRLVEAGALESAVLERAAALAALPARAYGDNKRLALEPTLERIRTALRQDFAGAA